MVMAFSGLGVWALVGQSLVAPAITALLAWITTRWRPNLMFNRREFATMTQFGGKVLGVEFVAMIRASGEAAVISSMLGAAALGYMTIAPASSAGRSGPNGERDRAGDDRRFRSHQREQGTRPQRLPACIAHVVRSAVSAAHHRRRRRSHDGPDSVWRGLGGELSHRTDPRDCRHADGGAWLDHGLFYGLGKPGKWFVYALVIDGLTLTTTAVLARFGLVAVASGFLGVCVVATISRWFLVARVLSAPVRRVAGPFLFVVTAVVTSGAARVVRHAACSQPPRLGFDPRDRGDSDHSPPDRDPTARASGDLRGAGRFGPLQVGQPHPEAAEWREARMKTFQEARTS